MDVPVVSKTEQRFPLRRRPFLLASWLILQLLFVSLALFLIARTSYAQQPSSPAGSVSGSSPELSLADHLDRSVEFRPQYQITPTIVIQKLTNGSDADTVPGPTIRVGNPVTWTYIVTNTSAVTITQVTVRDDKIGAVTCPSSTLGSNASMTCRMTGVAASGQYTNTGVVTATVPLSPTQTINASDLSHYFGASPAVTIKKYTNAADADATPGPSLLVGSAVAWTYVVQNTGNINLSGVTVSDDKGVTVTCPATTLAPGASMTCTANGVAQLGQYSNTGSVSAAAAGGPNVTASDPSHYLGVVATSTSTPSPGLTISVTPSEARVNQRFTFTVKVTNTGATVAPNAILTDAFPTFIDVESVTTTKGTASRSTHSLSVNIGTVNIGDDITITIVVRVNSAATRSETLSNIVTLSYGTNLSKSVSVTYRVVASAVLPGTGELPLTAVQPRSLGPDRTSRVAGLAIFLLGGLGLSLFPRWRMSGIRRTALIISLLLGIAFLVAACQSENLPPPVEAIKGEGVSQIIDTQVPTRTLLPFMPASRFSTPEAIVTLPSFPIPSPTNVPAPVAGQPAPDTSAVVAIEIPSLSVNTEVKYVPFDGLSWYITGLRQEVAWLGNTSWPGLGGNTVLAGHVTVRGLGEGPFRYLENLAAGDLVRLYTEQNIYTYRVREQITVEDTDMGVTLATVKPQLTLVTCTGWDTELELYRYRRVVFADLTETELLIRQGSR